MLERIILGLSILAAMLASVLSDANAAGLVAIIDPGHGGPDTGTRAQMDGRTLEEKALTLTVAKLVVAELQQHGIRTVLTRSDDKGVGLDERVAIANREAAKAKQALFVSIHLNSNSDTRIRGHELYVFNAATNEAGNRLSEIENGSHRVAPKGTVSLILSDLAASSNYYESTVLGCATSKALDHAFRMASLEPRSHGVRHGLLYVLLETRMPGVLAELGYLSNPAERAQLASRQVQATLAKGIADGIRRTFTILATPKHALAMSGAHKTRARKLDTVACP